jgi:hypothetical protein
VVLPDKQQGPIIVELNPDGVNVAALGKVLNKALFEK